MVKSNKSHKKKGVCVCTINFYFLMSNFQINLFLKCHPFVTKLTKLQEKTSCSVRVINLYQSVTNPELEPHSRDKF